MIINEYADKFGSCLLDARNELIYKYDQSGVGQLEFDFKGSFSQAYTPPTGIFVNPQPTTVSETIRRLGLLLTSLANVKA